MLSFPLNPGEFTTDAIKKLGDLSATSMDNLRRTSIRRKAVSERTGLVGYDEFWPRHSERIIDDIDQILARHYGFTNEELDFIINYDIKCRMGGADDEAGEG